MELNFSLHTLLILLMGSSCSTSRKVSKEQANQSILVTRSCQDMINNLCTTFELSRDAISEKEMECTSYEGNIWSLSRCVIEGPYTACKNIQGNFGTIEMTWTVFDPSRRITEDSCSGIFIFSE